MDHPTPVETSTPEISDQGHKRPASASSLTAVPTQPASHASSNPPKRRRPYPKLFLRDIPASGRYFWKESLAEQFALEMADRNPEQKLREMPKHEILTMALNEVAVDKGYGFFFYLAPRDGGRRVPSIDLCPSSRLPPPPGYVLSETVAER